MDPALLREREKFKQRALAIPAVEKRSEAKKEPKEKSGKSSKRKSKLSRPKAQPLVPPGIKLVPVQCSPTPVFPLACKVIR